MLLKSADLPTFSAKARNASRGMLREFLSHIVPVCARSNRPTKLLLSPTPVPITECRFSVVAVVLAGSWQLRVSSLLSPSAECRLPIAALLPLAVRLFWPKLAAGSFSYSDCRPIYFAH